jgi:hypothetical protein
MIVAVAERGVVRTAAAGRERGALLQPDFHIALGQRELFCRRQRSHLRRQILGIAEPDCIAALDQPRHDLVMDRALHDEARALHAGLPRGDEGGK